MPPSRPERWQYGLRLLRTLPAVIGFAAAGATGGLGKGVGRFEGQLWQGAA